MLNPNTIVDTMVGLRRRHKFWLKRHRAETGKSASRTIRELLDKEIKRQDRKAKRAKQKEKTE